MYIVDAGYGTFSVNNKDEFFVEKSEFPHMFDKETADYIESIYMTAKSYTWREWYSDQIVYINLTLISFSNETR